MTTASGYSCANFIECAIFRMWSLTYRTQWPKFQSPWPGQEPAEDSIMVQGATSHQALLGMNGVGDLSS